MKKAYVNPVVSSSTKKIYPSPSYNTPQKLETKLHSIGIDITLGNALKGGFSSSQVYETDWQGKPAVVKHTEHLIPFDPTEIFIDKKGHNIDTKVLKSLSKSTHVRVPQIYLHLPAMTTTIMEDLRASDYGLLHDHIMEKRLTVASAKPIGTMLTRLARESREWIPFHTNESAEQNIYERGLELRLAYPNNQTQYLALEKEYTAHDPHWLWPDGHPKNILIKPNGEPAFIDFGRSHWGDQRYMLPNFLAHIVIYSLAGYIDPDLAVSYIQDCVQAYRKIEPIDESIFCRYLAMEVFHRANGKWVSGIDSAKQKTTIASFAFTIFDEQLDTIDTLIQLLTYT